MGHPLSVVYQIRKIGVLTEEKKGYAAVLDHLMSERQNVLDYVKGLQEQRERLNQMLIEKLQLVLSTLQQGRSSCGVEETRTLQVGILFNVLTVSVFFLVEEAE